MKIRTNFVSNSSSTSFMIFGIRLFETDLEKLTNTGYIKDHYETEKGEQLLNETDIGLVNDCDGNVNWIGRCYSTIKDDETGKQFKESTIIKISTLLGKDVSCSLISESWYNG